MCWVCQGVGALRRVLEDQQEGGLTEVYTGPYDSLRGLPQMCIWRV
jgi:hypothetical protein